MLLRKTDAEFEDWRKRELGEYIYPSPDTGYVKLRENVRVNTIAVLTSGGIDRESDRRILVLSVAP